MTREEAESCIGTIELLRRLAYNIHGVMDVIDADNCEKIIKALSQEPTVTSTDEPMTMVYPTIVCDDAVSRKELLKAIDTWDKFGVDADTKLVRYQDHYVPYIHYDDVIKCIKGMPSVTQKSGKWINKDFRKEEYVLIGKCSVCGQVRVIDEFCSYCGAKMVEPQEGSEE